jgi:hypothetical protein
MNDLETAAELRHLIKHLQAEVRAIEARSGKPPTPDPISDHAIVRYMERVKAIDMRRLRTEILPHERRGLLSARPGRTKCKGYELVCNGGVVVTVI